MNRRDLQEDFYNFGYMDREEENSELKKTLKRQKKLTRKMIIILVIFLLLGAVYFFFFRGKSNSTTTYNAANYNPVNQAVQMANPEQIVNGVDVEAISNGTFNENQYISNVTGLDESWISSLTNQIKQMMGFQ